MHPSATTADPTADQNRLQGPPRSGAPGYHRAAHPKRPGLAPKGANYDNEGSRRMHPSPSGADPTASITVLPPAGREEMLQAAGLSTSAHWPEAERWGHGPDDAADCVPADAAWDDPDEAARELEERGFLMDGGWSLAQAGKGSVRHVDDGGMTSHRGVLHPDEYVDPDTLQGLVERELGFTYEQVRSVYRQGPLTADQRELRGQIDARLLALSRTGGNLSLLGRLLGFKTTGDTLHRFLKNALARARALEEAAA